MNRFIAASSLANTAKQLNTQLTYNSWQPTDEELTLGFKHAERLVLQKKLNIENVSLYGQRVMAHLCVLNRSKQIRMGNVLEIEGFWPQAKSMFASRSDVISCDVLLSNIGNVVESKLTMELSDLASDIFELCLNVDTKSHRARQFLSNHQHSLGIGLGEFVGSLVPQRKAWINGRFELFCGLEAAFSDVSSLSWMNQFFRVYFEQGLVTTIETYCSPNTHVKFCRQLPDSNVLKDIPDGDIYLVLQLGSAVIAYSTQADECFISEPGTKVATFNKVVSQLPVLKYNLGIHLSKTGLWQYRASYMLKNATKFAPKRADYMVK
ncbi:hypothetical protein AB4342_12515 [Vibrio breoganii]|uniref:hypothetical protein n=1 Tax=Vibrio breoganii TaxID=553239 RepID=UPI000C85F33D|nr:hypothetical protein [Vibrio breoganii]PMJ44289.1 hypothetical protein BCU21_16070 [Vibrio breoganii]PMK59412.1 hypothetical protein BCT97_06380 [Vibrio breoganii]PMM86757.1 hypothetical protein BCT45_05590 [Vibrio breoganii]PMO29211.1 hypothetical protein BCT14_06555 [Vibrio breoganii]PMO32953.1 hypothetical protein BCT13_08640 [Vibrio breoganii]